MPSHLGPLRVEIIAPESDKFTAPLLLVHGLWAGAASWRGFAGYLAHRGWRCHAVECEGDDLTARAAALRGAVAALEAPPVIVGHDLGALLALRCSDGARAVAALAPLVGPPFGNSAPALRGAGSWLARRRGAPLRAPRGGGRAVYPRSDRKEPAALVQSLLTDSLRAGPLAATVPAAVFAGECDSLLDPSQARAFAEQIGAEAHVLAGAGHAMLDEPGWDERVAAVHRWIVTRLGVDLLALYDEAWEGQEKP